MTVIPFPDAQSRAADPATSAFVTANAGSGKTYTLVSRVARLLLGGAKPEAILCVTYTKAAAAEMQRRLFERLGRWSVMPDAALRGELFKLEHRPEESITSEQLSLARALFAQALETPGGLKIQTIHAFCEKLLRRFPLEADVAPSFTVMDDAAAADIVAAAREQVAWAALRGEPLVTQAYERFAQALDFGAFEQMFRTFEDKRRAIARYVFEDVGGPEHLQAAVAAACRLDRLQDPAEVEKAAVSPPALDPQAWLAAAAGLARGAEKSDQPKGRRLQAVAEAALRGETLPDEVRDLFFNGSGGPRAKLATKDVDAATCEWLSQEQARLMEAFETVRANRVAWDTLSALVLAGYYAKAYEDAKAARGALDFADLIHRTHELLTVRADAAWVLFKLDGGLDHILVDEAQDTAPEQWAIIQALTDEFFSGAGAPRPGRPAERTLFVVGDEKQSIFSFQGAAPERLIEQRDYYDRTIKGVGQAFEAVPLLESRRSTPEVLQFVDAVFASPETRGGLQPRSGEAGAPQELIRHLAHRRDHQGTIDLWPLEREPDSEERRAWDEPLDVGQGAGAYRRLADRIADEVGALIAAGEQVHDKEAGAYRPANAGDVIVLVRKRGVLFEEVLRALKRKGLPVAGADRLQLGETAVFEDLLALARFALYPDDDLTLAALLRSPLCDVSEEGDGGLFALAHGRASQSLWSALRARRGEHPAWGGAADLLEAVRVRAAGCTPFDFYARLLNRTDEEGRSLRTRFVTRLGAEAADALDEFLAQLMALERRGVRDLQTASHALASLEVTVKREMDEAKGEVRVMTAHGAKGLEAPIVFLPETISRGAARDSALMETADDGLLWCASERNDCQASGEARALRKQKAEDEALRLLYVALTRARDRLVVAGRIDAKGKAENVKGWYKPLCEAMDHADIVDRVRQVEQPDGYTFRRFGVDPERSGTAPPGAGRSIAPLPDWTSRHAAPEPAITRYASPSQLAEVDRGPAPSPLLVTAHGMGRLRRGDLIHRLLQLLPDVAPDTRWEAAERMLARERDLTEGQRREIASAAFGVLHDPMFAEVFGPDSRAEVALAGQAPDLPAGLPVSGRVDRLVVTPERVLVADYKSNRPSPDRIEDADDAYIVQMAVYVALLRVIFPTRSVEAAIVWSDGPKLMIVPPALIEARLARLRRGG